MVRRLGFSVDIFDVSQSDSNTHQDTRKAVVEIRFSGEIPCGLSFI